MKVVRGAGDVLAEVHRLKDLLEKVAETNSGPQTLVSVLERLQELGDLSEVVLRRTKIGVAVNKVAKSPSPPEAVRATAHALVKNWKEAQRKRTAVAIESSDQAPPAAEGEQPRKRPYAGSVDSAEKPRPADASSQSRREGGAPLPQDDRPKTAGANGVLQRSKGQEADQRLIANPTSARTRLPATPARQPVRAPGTARRPPEQLQQPSQQRPRISSQIVSQPVGSGSRAADHAALVLVPALSGGGEDDTALREKARAIARLPKVVAKIFEVLPPIRKRKSKKLGKN